MSRLLLALARDPAAFLGTVAADVRRRGGVPKTLRGAHNGEAYTAPRDLEVTPARIARVLLVGSCQAERWLPFIPAPVDFVATNHLHELPESPPQPLESYDFQIVQIPLRSVIEDDLFWHCSWTDGAAWEAAYQHALVRLQLMLALRMAWNRRSGLLTFVANFPVPQRNPIGRSLPRYELRNPVAFVERLNEALAKELATYANASLLDLAELASVFGKKYVQDDSVDVLNHASVLAPSPFAASDRRRLEPLAPIGEYYEIRSDAFLEAVWLECVAMYRTAKRLDAVKLVIVDLDDTLWRGVLAEEGRRGFDVYEGWPLGIAEALLYLKMRGVLLAIVSKNDEAQIAALWEELFGGRLRLDDFAIRRINWEPKSANVREILAAVNVLPESTVFIDDNPRERAEVQAAFPAIRLLGAHPYYVRRILLWSPETQVATVTNESALRTEMVRAQIEREAARSVVSLDDFLASLDVHVRLHAIASVESPLAERALELLAKTNQFNTATTRWSHDALRAALERGALLYAFEVRDRFTAYGLVGAAIVSGGTIVQFALSCRVFGLGVEVAALAEIVDEIGRSGARTVRARLERTAHNGPCHDFYARCGFHDDGWEWTRSTDQPIGRPGHLTLERSGVEVA